MSMQVILAQALLGLNVGVFYAMLSLGLAVIFGLLNIINFAHGAMYMLGAFIASLATLCWSSGSVSAFRSDSGRHCWWRP